jgi:hypothetical protein
MSIAFSNTLNWRFSEGVDHKRGVHFLGSPYESRGTSQISGSSHREILLARLAPSGAIDKHDHEEVLEIFGDLLQKEAHHFSVCIRKYEESHLPQSHANRCVHVQKFAYNLPGRFWPNPLGSPTVPVVADPTKSALILRHENDWPCVFRISFSKDVGYRGREFFKREI